MGEDENVRKIAIHLIRLGLIGFVKSEEFDLFCEENGLEDIKDTIFKSLMRTNNKPIPIKGQAVEGELIIDFSNFPESLIKPFFKEFLVIVYTSRRTQFIEIIVSFLAAYSRYNRNFGDNTPTPIDDNSMRTIAIDLLNLGYDKEDLEMHLTHNGYDLEALLSTYDPKPVKSQDEPITISKKIPNDFSSLNRKIFIVHGHDSTLKRDVETYLRTLSLEPIILHQQVSRNKTIIEKVEFYSDVSFAIILLTADDIGAEAGIGSDDEYGGYARGIDSEYFEDMDITFSEFLKQNNVTVKDNRQTFVEVRDLFKVLKMRSRQNVLFECGYFIGKLGRENVAILCDPVIEIPTDLNGLCYLKIDESGSWRKDLAMEINAAGITIDEKSLSIYERMKSYLIENGFKLLKITSKTPVNHAKDIINNNIQTFSPDFIDEMKSVGFGSVEILH